MGSDAGGERAAAIYSLVETARLNRVDLPAYLREVLERIAAHRRTATLDHRFVISGSAGARSGHMNG
jgi:hypothetical protein